MILPSLYHWSPGDRREVIRADGLRPYEPPPGSQEAMPWAMGCGVVCLGTSPMAAWRLSGGLDTFRESDQEWDLWQVELANRDEIHVRSEFGASIDEVRVANAIPGDRVWWVGTRG